MVNLLRDSNRGHSFIGHRVNAVDNDGQDYGEGQDGDFGRLLGIRRGGQHGLQKLPKSGRESVSETDGHDSDHQLPDLFSLNDTTAPSSDVHIDSGIKTCRNSVQGKVMIADDQGYCCLRKDLASSGCCDVDAVSSKRYSCETCSDNGGCCAIYEHCVSCCLEPAKKPLLSKLISAASNGGFPSNVLYASLTDHYEFCLARCRTSSQSVQHENSYRDPKAKHCFGANAAGGHQMQSAISVVMNEPSERKETQDKKHEDSR
jgi:hypothetical protein